MTESTNATIATLEGTPTRTAFVDGVVRPMEGGSAFYSWKYLEGNYPGPRAK